MTAALCIIGLFLVDDYRKPEALLNLERLRKTIVTVDMDYWRQYDIGPDHPGSGRPFLRRVTLARDQSMRVIQYGFEGYISSLYDTGDAVSTTPVSELHRGGEVWSYKDWDLNAFYHGSKGRAGTSQPDPRTFGLLNKDDSRARSLLPAIWQVSFSDREVVRYTTTVDGPIHTVRAISQSGWERIFKISADKGWNPEEIMRVSPDGKVTERIVSTLGQFDGVWFPKEIAFYDRDGVLYETVNVERLEINRPEHPERLTLADIGVDDGMVIQFTPESGVFGVGGGPITFSADNIMAWDGENVVSLRKYQERFKRGEVQRGPKITAMREQLKQGTYRHPDDDLREAYNLRRQLRKGAVSEWEAYVRKFVEKYRLNHEQQRKAYQILRRCQEKANAYVLKHKAELTKKDLDVKRKAELLAPVNRIFEKDLKSRLEQLPTRAQRRAAEATSKPTKAQADRP